MKKILIALCAAFVLAGCSNSTTPNEPTTENNETVVSELTVESFNEQLSSTEAGKVRVYVSSEENRSAVALDTKADEALVKEIQTVISETKAEQAESQDKIFDDPYYFVELNTRLDDNFIRFVVYGDNTLMIANANEYVNYTLTAESFEALATAFEGLVTADAE